MSAKIDSNYSGEVLDRLLARVFTHNELVAGGHIRVEPNVRHKFHIPRLRAGKMLQRRKEMPKQSDSKGEFLIDEKTLEPKDLMAFTTFNPRSFERIWRKWQPTGALVFSELPPEAQNALLAEMAKVVNFELGEHFITGKEGKVEGEYFDGILTRIVNDKEVVRLNGKKIDEGNVLGILQYVRSQIPTTLRGNANLKIFMSIEDFDIYDEVLTQKTAKGADHTSTNAERYKKIRIVPLANWPKNVIVAAVSSTSLDSNFWAAVAFGDDAETIKIDRLENAGELYFFKMLMKADTNIVFGEDIVLFDGRG